MRLYIEESFINTIVTMPLSSSQRIKLKKEIADRLAPEEWSLVDATLKEYGLPWSNVWSGSKNAYVLEMIAAAFDEVLIALARH